MDEEGTWRGFMKEVFALKEDGIRFRLVLQFNSSCVVEQRENVLL
jgi:hypothetical protein